MPNKMSGKLQLNRSDSGFPLLLFFSKELEMPECLEVFMMQKGPLGVAEGIVVHGLLPECYANPFAAVIHSKEGVNREETLKKAFPLRVLLKGLQFWIL